MQEINSLMGGFAVALTWFNVMLMIAGVSLGVLIGVLPGLGDHAGRHRLVGQRRGECPVQAPGVCRRQFRRRDVGHQYARRLGYLEFAVEWAIRQSPAQDPIEELRRTWHEYQSRTDW